MAAATTPAPVGQGQTAKSETAVPVVFDISKPPIVEGFSPFPMPKEEGFKEKFIRKTKENPFVPLGVFSALVNLQDPSLQGTLARRQAHMSVLYIFDSRGLFLVYMLGCLGTAGALTYGLIAFKHGKSRQSQVLMRSRIFAQGFTVIAIIVGVAITAMKPKQ